MKKLAEYSERFFFNSILILAAVLIGLTNYVYAVDIDKFGYSVKARALLMIYRYEEALEACDEIIRLDENENSYVMQVKQHYYFLKILSFKFTNYNQHKI
ncbi:unnamed protein product [Paramecium octaurelia]|uniref:Uncharacterized protein n=1 Tax=Paramecium octaurelia TaxID=43137 RepID=A0A8S1YJK7_PAROT|nr:unnamed protein product [Paramecium octaurelia]